MPPAPPPPTLACPRCATPLVTLAPGAAVGGLAVQCPRCGGWVRLGPAPTGGAQGSRETSFGPAGPGGAGAGAVLGGALEVVGLAAAGVGGLALVGLGFAARSFEAMARDLGGTLPGLSAFVFRSRLPWLLAALVLGLAAAALVIRLRGGTAGRWLVGAALGLVLLGAPVCIVSFYLPLFSLAGSIR